MNRWHNYYLDGHPHFCTATVIDWQPLLTNNAVNIVYDEWNTAREKLSVEVLAYVIMPNHFHVILWAKQEDQISLFLRRVLSLTARRIKPGGGLWKERPRVLPIGSASLLKTKVDYLHRNPLRKELVVNPEDWEHSSYRQLVLGAENVPFVCDVWDGVC